MPEPSTVKNATKSDNLVKSTATEVAPRRQDVAKNRREDRKKAYDRNRRQWLITKLVLGVVGALVIVAIGYAIYTWGTDRNLNKIPDGVKSYSYPPGQHDDAFNSWTEVPPAGGVHNNVWQTCGFYSSQIGSGNGVHSLEHGAIWITYQPDLAQDEVDKLKKIAEGQDFILVSPYPGLPSPVVASAWNKQLQLKSADDKALEQFIHVFKNNATYTPEFGATCSGGTDATTG